MGSISANNIKYIQFYVTLHPGQKLKLFKTLLHIVPLDRGNFDVRGSAAVARTAVAELLNSQVCLIKLISFLASCCILIFFIV